MINAGIFCLYYYGYNSENDCENWMRTSTISEWEHPIWVQSYKKHKKCLSL